jgi:hypothetical protein
MDAMKPTWRGVVVDGVVWAWPTLLMTHDQAFAAFPYLSDYTARFRQWNPGESVDFDSGVSDDDRALVKAWIDLADPVIPPAVIPPVLGHISVMGEF